MAVHCTQMTNNSNYAYLLLTVPRCHMAMEENSFARPFPLFQIERGGGEHTRIGLHKERNDETVSVVLLAARKNMDLLKSWSYTVLLEKCI